MVVFSASKEKREVVDAAMPKEMKRMIVIAEFDVVVTTSENCCRDCEEGLGDQDMWIDGPEGVGVEWRGRSGLPGLSRSREKRLP